jgi:mannosyltransferase
VPGSVPFSRSALKPQRALLTLAVITLAGLALRIAWAGQQPLWSDEALTLVIAKWPVQDLLFRPVDPTPGLYYLLHKWLVADDASITAVRGISIVAGTLSIPAVYAVGRLAISRSAGLLAAALLALSPVLIDYSQEARVYALELLLVLASAAGLLAWTRRLGGSGGGLGLAIFAVATVLVFSAHLVSIFWVIPVMPLAISATVRRGTPAQKRLFLLCAVLMALGAAFEIERLLWRVSIGGGFSWLAQASPLDALATWGRTVLPLSNSRTVSIGAVILVVMLIGWRIVVNRDQWHAWIVEHDVAARVIAIMLLAPIGVWLIGFVLVPIFMPRTILIGIPGFILLLVLVVHLERKPWPALALMLLFGLSLILTGPVREKEDWRSVAGALQRNVRPGDVVVVCPEWKYPALRHALTPLLDVPAVTTSGEGMVLTEAPVGSNRAWAQNYFRASVEPLMRQKMKQPAIFPSQATVARPFRRAWLVDSECGTEQRRSVQAWLGRGRWALALDRPATVQHAGIRLWRFEGERPIARLVLTVPS